MTDSSTYTVERSTEIDAKPEHVYAQLVDFHRWTAWSPWEDLDPELQRTYSGPEQGVGATYAWKGNRKAGEGRMEITRAAEPGTVAIALRFVKPFKSSSTSMFVLAPAGEGTRVTWTMTGPKTFMTKVMGVFTSMDKLVGPDFEKGLARLKAVSEASTAS
ncbi:MAG: SRPBCC family protein [Nocardioidaceae bacterium]|nr:SRPBCC family protein [Nocardioidaceae bacterium]